MTAAAPTPRLPAVVGNTYLGGSYSEVYPEIGRDEAGLKKLSRQFSFPGGIPSHASPECPGSIHEGGELGYSPSHSFGAVFDNPSSRDGRSPCVSTSHCQTHKISVDQVQDQEVLLPSCAPHRDQPLEQPVFRSGGRRFAVIAPLTSIEMSAVGSSQQLQDFVRISVL